jgi:thiol-disulfide isomerase/thioredoxin
LEIGRRDMAMGVLAVGLFGDMVAVAKVGRPAPPFTVTTFDGRRVTREDLAGKVVVLNFWATWCAPCRIELPMLDRYLRDHPDGDLQLFAVTTEGSVPDSALRPLARQLSFPLATRISGHGYGPLDAIPTNYVIDRAGIVRWAKSGAFTEDSLGAVVGPLLAARAPPPAMPSAGGQSTT